MSFASKTSLITSVLIVSMIWVGITVLFTSDRQADVSSAWNRGWQALENGDLSDARIAYRELEKAAPNSPQLIVLRAGLALKRGDYPSVLESLDPALASGELRRPVLILISEAMYRVEDLEAARVVALAGAKDFPDEAHFCRVLSGIYYDLGAIQQALHQVDQLIRLVPADYRPHYLAAVIHDDFDHPDEAIRHLTIALEKSPPEEPTHEMLDMLVANLVKERRYQEALRVIADHSTWERQSYWRAHCLAGLGRTEEALDAARIAHEAGIDEPGLLGLKARILDDSGKHLDAIPLLERAVQLKPHDAQLQYQLAQAFDSAGQGENARSAFERFRRTQELREKLTLMSQKADEDIESAETRDELAGICAELGLDRLAETWRAAANHCRKRAESRPRS
jgi:tetratricopeptide (TPR) repeat protein